MADVGCYMGDATIGQIAERNTRKMSKELRAKRLEAEGRTKPKPANPFAGDLEQAKPAFKKMEDALRAKRAK